MPQDGEMSRAGTTCVTCFVDPTGVIICKSPLRVNLRASTQTIQIFETTLPRCSHCRFLSMPPWSCSWSTDGGFHHQSP